MPGPALHHMICDRLRFDLMSSTGLGNTLPASRYNAIDAQLANPGSLPYLFLGCQGPDFLFFNTKDMPGPIHDLVTAYFDVYDWIKNFLRDLKALVPQPVLDALSALNEAANEVVTSSSTLTELQQLFGNMKAVVTALTSTLLEAVKRFISEFSLFDIISHPYRDGVPQNEPWWWFDAMHYRHTGKFARRLLEKTKPGTQLHLYAIGYLTHVTADTVGHPYVNAISGGPYRSHAQRHKASENYQDVLNFRFVRGMDWNYSKVHAFYNFNYRGQIDTENEIPDPFTQLPNDLADLIISTLQEIYNEDRAAPSPDYGKPMTREDINDTYRLWYRWFRSATDTDTLPPPVPYSFTQELREVWDKAMDNLGGIGDFIEDAANTAGRSGIWGIFLMLGALILGALAAAAAVIDAVLGAITTLGSATIRYAACLIYEQLYSAYENFRLAVAMNGLAFPMTQHLTEPRITHFANPALPDANGKNVQSILGRLPSHRWRVASLTHNERHLIYPPMGGESPNLFSVPSSYLNEFSTWYAWGQTIDDPADKGALNLDPDILEELVSLQNTSQASQSDAASLAALLNDKHLLGNALKLTEGMYDRFAAGKILPDFNLDGDRGYGYLCWTQRGDSAPDFPNPIASELGSPPGPQPVDIQIDR